MSNRIKIDYGLLDKPIRDELKSNNKSNNISRRLSAVRTALEKTKKQELGFDERYMFVAQPFDDAYYQPVYACVQAKLQLSCEVIVVIGIGGSGLGARAVHEALHGCYWNEDNRPRVYFADTIDPQESAQIHALVQKTLESGKKILLVMVSKTGTTLESTAHFCVYFPLLKQYYPANYSQYIVVISDNNSKLAQYAREQKIDVLPIPVAIGGRYSVFTAVGIFVLSMLGVDSALLLNGAREATDHALTHDLEHNDAMLTALALYQQYQQETRILDYFIFSKTCAGIGQWYRQLVGESLGKKTARDTCCSLTPTVSIGSNDLHAVAQLYLGGRPQIFTQFLTVAPKAHDFEVPACSFDSPVSGFSYSQLMEILFQATKRAYDEQQLPYIHLQLADCSAYTIGYLLQFHMLQVVYLAALLEVNPFDQPQVELYKKHARLLLAH